jgi:autotransporter-associated beta strand protein
VTLIPFIEGRVDFGSSPNTINVASIDVNGATDVAPLQRALLLRGIVGSSGALTKSGNGVLELGAQQIFTGSLTVTAGGLRNGVANAGSRYSALTLNSGTRYDLNNQGTTWGSLAGAGTVFNSGTTANTTLTVGFDNTSTTFSGTFARYNDVTLNPVALTKIGTGTLSLTSAQTTTNGSTGTVTINGGGLTFSGAGKWFTGTTTPAFAGTFTLNNGGTLTLDNSGTNVNSRLGLNATGTLNLQGGKLVIGGNATAATATTEGITTFNVTNGGGRVELTPNAANPLTLAITTLSGGNSTGSLVIGGLTGAASANGVANLTIGTASLIGTQGGGNNGTSNMSVRHDILADASAIGLGTGFLVKDSSTNNYRALGTSSAGAAVPTEFNTTPLTWTGTQNAAVTAATTNLAANTAANTLTFSGASTLGSGLDATAFGLYGPGGSLLTQTLSNASAALVLNGSTTNVNVGSFTTGSGTTGYLHVVGTGVLNINGYFGIGSTSGFVKADDGTLNLNNLSLATGGNTTVNGGTLNLNSGHAAEHQRLRHSGRSEEL